MFTSIHKILNRDVNDLVNITFNKIPIEYHDQIFYLCNYSYNTLYNIYKPPFRRTKKPHTSL